MATTQTTEAHPIRLSTGDWRVDAERSELGFLTRIVFGLIAVRGRYSGFDGELHINGEGNASATSAQSTVVAPLSPSRLTLPTVPGLPQDGKLVATYHKWFLQRTPSGELIDLPISLQLTEAWRALGVDDF